MNKYAHVCMSLSNMPRYGCADIRTQLTHRTQKQDIANAVWCWTKWNTFFSLSFLLFFYRIEWKWFAVIHGKRVNIAVICIVLEAIQQNCIRLNRAERRNNRLYEKYVWNVPKKGLLNMQNEPFYCRGRFFLRTIWFAFHTQYTWILYIIWNIHIEFLYSPFPFFCLFLSFSSPTLSIRVFLSPSLSLALPLSLCFTHFSFGSMNFFFDVCLLFYRSVVAVGSIYAKIT